MRMSANENDPGYINLRPGAKVTVDGVPQKYCVTADEELGEAWCFVTGEDGSMVLTDDKTELLTECKRGRVVISIRCDNCGEEGFRLTDSLCDGCHTALKTANVKSTVIKQVDRLAGIIPHPPCLRRP